MRIYFRLFSAIIISILLIVGCSSTQTKDDNKDKKNNTKKVVKNDTTKKPNGNGMISDDKENSTTSKIKDNEKKKDPVYYEGKEEKKVEHKEEYNNDKKVGEAIAEMNIATRTMNYEKAYSIYKQAKKISPISDKCKEKLQKAANDIRPFIEAFRAIYQKQYRNDIYVIFLKNADTYIGVIVEDNTKRGYMVIQNFSTNSYVTIKTKDIAEKNKMEYDQQKKMLQAEFDEAAMKYISEEKTPLNMLMLAKTAWRYGLKIDAYKYLQKALKLDEDYIRQTISLLEDSEYKDFMDLYREDKLNEAQELLTKLVSKYPKADLFKRPAQKINEHVKEVERLREEEKRKIAAEIMARRKAEEEEFRRRMEEEKRKEEEAKKEAEAKEREEKLKELEKLAEFDENSELIQEKLKLSGPEILQEAYREYRLALKFDKASKPGVEDGEKLLGLAIYHYQFSKRLFQEAEKKGQDALGMVVKINKALFWCRKRRTIH